MSLAISLPETASGETTAGPVSRPRRIEPPLKGHIPALDAVRGLAILLVTLYRFRLGPDDSSLLGGTFFSLLSFGARGVDLFFVLSGFLITGILYDAKHKPHYFRDFYARRSLRIFPLYFGVLAASFIALPAVWSGPSPFVDAAAHQPWLWSYGVNLLIAWRAEWCFGYFDHFWSLAVEEHFYFFWPFVVYSCSRQAALRVAAVLAIASAAGRVVWATLNDNGIAADVFTLFRLDALLIGGWLALVARGPGGLSRLVPFARRAAWASGLVLVPLMAWHHRVATLPSTIYAVFFGAMIVLAINAKKSNWTGRFWNSRFLQFLGKYSYGMYVFQNLLIPLLAVYFTAESLTQSFGSPFGGRLCYLAAMSLATLLIALASWHLYEKHFLKLKAFFGGGH